MTMDQTVLLSVDRVVVRNCEKDKVEKECAKEEEMVRNQTTMSASETWWVHENDEPFFCTV